MSKQSKKQSEDIEVEGSTIEEAIQKAMVILHVAREEMDVKIVCEEKKGLFGMEGESPAKIKVTVKEKHKKH